MSVKIKIVINTRIKYLLDQPTTNKHWGRQNYSDWIKSAVTSLEKIPVKDKIVINTGIKYLLAQPTASIEKNAKLAKITMAELSEFY